MNPNIPQYKPDHNISWETITEQFPEIANQIVSEDNWSYYERKPDFSEVDGLTMKWIPEKVRQGYEDERIDTIILTK